MRFLFGTGYLSEARLLTARSKSVAGILGVCFEGLGEFPILRRSTSSRPPSNELAKALGESVKETGVPPPFEGLVLGDPTLPPFYKTDLVTDPLLLC